MDDRQSILGFTEAELGFFLVLLFVVLWAVTTAAKPATPPTNPDLVLIHADSLEAMKRQVRRLQAEVDSLKSPIWPSCKSRGIANGPLTTVIALGGNLFRIGVDTISIAGLAARTEQERLRATGAQCRHEIRFGVLSSLNAGESENARRRIGGLNLRILQGPVVEK